MSPLVSSECLAPSVPLCLRFCHRSWDVCFTLQNLLGKSVLGGRRVTKEKGQQDLDPGDLGDQTGRVTWALGPAVCRRTLSGSVAQLTPPPPQGQEPLLAPFYRGGTGAQRGYVSG